MNILEVDNLSFSYQDLPILQNLSLQLKKGEIATLIGLSGSGKTTLFKLLTGLLPPRKGAIMLNGSVTYMTQDDLLLPWRTVIDNIILPCELGPTPNLMQNIREEANTLLTEMGISKCSEMFPDQLSGGMRQRVSLARALIQKHSLLLLDEPFTSLDISHREQMYTLLKKIQKKHGITILMITHDFRDALTLSDRIFLLKEGMIHREWEVSEENRHDLHHEIHSEMIFI